MTKTSTVLTFAQLKEGFIKTVENAVQFYGAAVALMQEYPDKSLALAQIGQEELGRSLTILAAFHLSKNSESFAWVWSGWSDHQLKAHRAYLYELIDPLRLEMEAPDGRKFAGEPLLDRISKEKEVGFYVDFDEPLGHFLAPAQTVSFAEAAARAATLTYLSATADAVRKALVARDESFRFAAFSEIALRICSEDVYQQDMPALFAEFRKRSARHDALISDLEVALSANSAFFQNLARTDENAKGEAAQPTALCVPLLVFAAGLAMGLGFVRFFSS